MASTIDYSALRAQTLGAGMDEEAVTVNTRALIDKVLARYSGEWTVLRELLQNAADASASKVIIKFETLPSSTVPLPSKPSPSALIKHMILHHTLKRLMVINNGHPFGPNDWSRLRRIAEGNPDETKIGAFGVGFYSVFSDCEEPFVSSGREAMAFYWKENSLFTRKLHLDESKAMGETSFVLDYRNSTTTVPSLLPLCQFLASSLTFVGLSNIELWLDDWKVLDLSKTTAPASNITLSRSLRPKTSEGVMQVQSVVHETSQLNAVWLKIVGWKPKNAAATTSSATGSKNQPSQSLRTFFHKLTSSTMNAAAEKAAREEQAAQEAIAEDLLGEGRASVFLHVNTAKIGTSVSKSFAVELERATKKPPPKMTSIAILTASYDESELSNTQLNTAMQGIDIFGSVLPSKSGRVFIGFPTHQTTGLAAHISAPSVIPTVERESIDLNARWVRTWNQELLRAAGIVCRIAWIGENQNLKRKLSATLTPGNTKIRESEVEKVLPHAIHNLAQFSFKESTPNLQVGSLVEEGFWTCDVLESIEILSSRGVLASQQVRLATDELSFVEGIPVVPKAIIDKASAFVKKLIEFGIITEVTTADILKELEKQALNSKQLVEFLHWLLKKMRTDDLDAGVIKSLLNVAVANDEESNKVILLSEVKYFLNPSRILLSLPVPPQTIPFKYTKDLQKVELEKLGWEDLQIIPWVKFLLDAQSHLSADQNLEKNAAFASQVLPSISKQWDGLGQGSKTTLVSLFTQRTVIPTKQGMRKPGDAYFPYVKLFEDLPVVTVNNVKEKMLIALGVRKTIDLNLIFERLLNMNTADEKGSTWSHVELIKYLVSVKNDIPRDDIKKLQSTPICTAEDDPKGQRYKITGLFEPKDELRHLDLKTLYWPGIYRPMSEEGKFLRLLGLRSAPKAPELIKIIATATSEMDIQLRERVLQYLVDYHHQHGYSSSEIGVSSTPFLPLEGKEKAVSVPSNCFTNPYAALLGYEILRHDLHPHAAKLGVQANPPIDDCVNWFVKNPPKNHRSARQLFEYFASRLNELGGRPAEILSKAHIVPIMMKSSETSGVLRYLPPSMCFLGSEGKYAEILDYVDFNDVANSFLIRCGSKPEPTSLELARLVVSTPVQVYSTLNSTDKYLNLLSTVAEAWPTLKKDKTLMKEMKSSSFLLASIEVPSEMPVNSSSEHANADNEDDQSTVKKWKLAYAKDTVIVDHVVNYALFKNHILAVPPEEELESFYLSLGAELLSTLVEETPRVGQANRDQGPARQLRELVGERIKLFLHDIPQSQIKRDAAWISENLNFIAVPYIQVHKRLKQKNISHVEQTTAIYRNERNLGPSIFFKPFTKDLFYVSQSIMMACLSRPKPNQAIILTTLLDTDLNKLRSRGYDVARILKKREAAKAKIVEEERVKRLEEEKTRLQEADNATIARQRDSSFGSEGVDRQLMPGIFPETPDHDTHVRHSVGNGSISQPTDGLLSTFRKVWNDGQNHVRDFMGSSNSEQSGSQTSLVRAPQTKTPQLPQRPHTIVSPEHLSQKLISAVKASRPHNSQNVVSNPITNDVSETQTFCDAKSAKNITLAGVVASNMKVFLPRVMEDTTSFMTANSSGLHSFAFIAREVGPVMQIPHNSLHLFWEDSSTIAFNSNGALFLNYFYFEKLHLSEVQQGSHVDAIIYWFIVLCHELAHNIVSDHSSAHSYYTESFITHFFKNVAARTHSTIGGAPPPAYTSIAE